MGVARSALWAPDRAGGHFHGRNSMSYLYIFEKTAEIVFSKPKQSLTKVKHLTGIILKTITRAHNLLPRLSTLFSTGSGSLVSRARPQGLLVLL